MKKQEILHIFAAIIILTAIAGFEYAIKNNWNEILNIFAFSIILILVAVFSKKLMANFLDADVEHSIWQASRYGFRANWHLEKEVPAGIIFPIFFSLFSLGAFKIPTLLVYETSALKRRAAKRFGFYSCTEITDAHNALIGAAGIIGVLLLATITYLSNSNFENLAILSTLYAFFNMIPISKLDGAQIFYGSRVIWTTVAAVTAVFTFYAFLIAFGII